MTNSILTDMTKNSVTCSDHHEVFQTHSPRLTNNLKSCILFRSFVNSGVCFEWSLFLLVTGVLSSGVVSLFLFIVDFTWIVIGELSLLRFVVDFTGNPSGLSSLFLFLLDFSFVDEAETGSSVWL